MVLNFLYKLTIIFKYCSLLLDTYNARKTASIIYLGLYLIIKVTKICTRKYYLGVQILADFMKFTDLAGIKFSELIPYYISRAGAATLDTINT